MDNYLEKAPTRSKLPVIFFAIVATAILIGVGIYAMNRNQSKPAVQPSITIAPTPAPTSTTTTATETTTKTTPASPPAPAVDPTASWKPYSDTEYGVSFKYPTTWPAFAASTIKENADGPFWEFNANLLNFGNYDKTVELSTYDSYRKSANSDAALNIEVDRLAKLFTTKNADTAPAFWLPPSNATIAYHTTPIYIENKTGTYRGVYYFAAIGQDTPGQENGAYKLNDFMLVLTDGTSKIFQFQEFSNVKNQDADTAAYEPATSCIDSSGNAASCVVNKQLLTDFESEYKNVAASVQ